MCTSSRWNPLITHVVALCVIPYCSVVCLTRMLAEDIYHLNVIMCGYIIHVERVLAIISYVLHGNVLSLLGVHCLD